MHQLRSATSCTSCPLYFGQLLQIEIEYKKRYTEQNKVFQSQSGGVVILLSVKVK